MGAEIEDLDQGWLQGLTQSIIPCTKRKPIWRNIFLGLYRDELILEVKWGWASQFSSSNYLLGFFYHL